MKEKAFFWKNYTTVAWLARGFGPSYHVGKTAHSSATGITKVACPGRRELTIKPKGKN
jgi:hypothetical protein